MKIHPGLVHGSAAGPRWSFPAVMLTIVSFLICQTFFFSPIVIPADCKEGIKDGCSQRSFLLINSLVP